MLHLVSPYTASHVFFHRVSTHMQASASFDPLYPGPFGTQFPFFSVICYFSVFARLDISVHSCVSMCSHDSLDMAVQALQYSAY
jgi:hypothetical protein